MAEKHLKLHTVSPRKAEVQKIIDTVQEVVDTNEDLSEILILLRYNGVLQPFHSRINDLSRTLGDLQLVSQQLMDSAKGIG